MKGGLAVAIALGAVGVGLVAGLTSTPKTAPIPIQVDVPASAPTGGTRDAVSHSEQTEAASEVSGREAGKLYSDFVGQIQSHLFGGSILEQRSIGHIKQDIDFRDLAALRRDAAELKEQARNVANSVESTPDSWAVSDADAKYFDEVRDAASALADEVQNMAVDIAVAADSGLDPSNDFQQSAPKIEPLRTTFERKVMAGYKHFGYKKSEINMTSLTIKP
ncbi:hypothetical protein ACXKTX_09560 [Burkholderia gladioli]